MDTRTTLRGRRTQRLLRRLAGDELQRVPAVHTRILVSAGRCSPRMLSSPNFLPSTLQHQLVHEFLDIYRRFSADINQPTCTDGAKSGVPGKRLNFLNRTPLFIEVPWMATAGEEATYRRFGGAPAMNLDDFTRKRS